MSRRHACLSGLVSVLVVLGGVLAAPPVTSWARPHLAAGQRPDVMLFLADDMNVAGLAQLPKTRRWFARGTTYTRAYVAISACCPDRSALYTGRYPHNNGVLRQRDGAAFDAAHSLARYLQDAGYRTNFSGKFLTTWPEGRRPPFFDDTVVTWSGYVNPEVSVNGVAGTARGYSTTYLGRQTRRQLAGCVERDSACLLVTAYQAPHVSGGASSLAIPADRYASAPVGECARPGEADRSDKPPYMRRVTKTPAFLTAVCQSQLRALKSVDDDVDATLRALRRAGRLDDTLACFLSDNGFLWGEHGRDKKFVPYEPSVRIPLLCRWPGHLPAGSDDRLVSVLDLLPTVLEAAGVTPAIRPDGRSLRAERKRTSYFTEYFADPANGPMPSTAALVSARTKLIRTYDSSGALSFEEYYDLAADPAEDENVLAGGRGVRPSAATLTGLRAALEAARSCAGTTCP